MKKELEVVLAVLAGELADDLAVEVYVRLGTGAGLLFEDS